MAKYYLMKQKVILRMEESDDIQNLDDKILKQILDSKWQFMNQEQANYRVAIFRDEIMELDEYQLWLKKNRKHKKEESTLKSPLTLY
ncbi:MAG: hypothetical protein QE271_10260 [Bacteriovoracaceae bacterium]|nr:hypothetical protein [Bacteriovoracaceae bacterium]